MEAKLVLVLADIHANEPALRAVLNDALERYEALSEIWFLGDLFGRGPDPVTIWRKIQGLAPKMMLVGNHDWGLLGKHQDVRTPNGWDGMFNPPDWEILLQHRSRLKDVELLQFDGRGTPVAGPVMEQVQDWAFISTPYPGIYAVHGGVTFDVSTLQRAAEAAQQPFGEYLADNLIWSYVKTAEDARCTIELMEWLSGQAEVARSLGVRDSLSRPQMVLVGHYHKRILFRTGHGMPWQEPVVLDERYQLEPNVDEPILVSPGSVGFPRERQSRAASYAVLQLKEARPTSIIFHACAYDRAAVRQRMREQNYPSEVIDYLCEPGEALED